MTTKPGDVVWPCIDMGPCSVGFRAAYLDREPWDVVAIHAGKIEVSIWRWHAAVGEYTETIFLKSWVLIRPPPYPKDL